MPALELKNLCISAGGRMILKNISFSVEEGEKVWIYGKSGSGKSSLIKSMLGFHPEVQGSIFIQGTELNYKSVWRIRRELAYLSQDADISDLRIADFIQAVFRLKSNRFNVPAHKDIFAAMDFLELDSALYQAQFYDLSGGEKQRFALMIAILLKKKIYLLDEPTSAQDKKLKKKIKDYFMNLDATLIVVSHDETWRQSQGLRMIELDKYKKDGNY
jgi:putative ABC transport system ATP-binding protein